MLKQDLKQLVLRITQTNPFFPTRPHGRVDCLIMKMKQKHTKEETLEVFKYWLARLSQFCDEYDKGDERVALLISNCLRLILKTTIRSTNPIKYGVKSLIKHLDLENTLFSDTRKNPKSYSFYTIGDNVSNQSILQDVGIDVYLLGINIENINGTISFRCCPLLEQNNMNSSKISFDEWYDQPVFAIPNFSLTRKQLVESIAEQDGGTHFDDRLTEEAYCALRQGDAFQLNVNGTIVQFENNPAYASIRQIAYEVLQTFNTFI